MNRRVLIQDTDVSGCRKKICLFAGIGFIGGILIANTFGRKIIMDMGIFGDYFFMQMQQMKVDSSTMFWYVFEKRFLFVLVLLLFGVTSFGKIAAYLLSAGLTCSLGFLLSAAVMQNGAKGLGICIIGFVPQCFFYVPAGFLMLVKTCQYSQRLYGTDKSGIYYKKKELTTYAVMSAGVLIAFFVGIILESLLNPILLQKIYKILNNI